MENAVTGMADVVGAMTTAMTSIAGQVMDGIGDIIPIAAPILGSMIIIRLGIKVFKKLGN